jgi:anhydro-N-acetylmuramic acid kinase
MQKSLSIIGLMSGTSRDGLDLALCQFEQMGDSFRYKILEADTYEYTKEIQDLITEAENCSGQRLTFIDRYLGTYFGNAVKKFTSQYQILEYDYISSHGHTIFHQPELGYTLQIGHGAHLAAAAGKSVITDFRSMDVALHGQGAPLVPIGDQLLFSQYHACINLGGIANISFNNKQGQRVAYDICVANMVLNHLAQKLGKPYDNLGAWAQEGTLIPSLLHQLNNLAYYKKKYPKSLGKEDILAQVFPLLKDDVAIKDQLHTLVIHITEQLALAIESMEVDAKDLKILITGGGAFNSFLINSLKKRLKSNYFIIIPDEKTVKYKEAIIFAFLGYLRIINHHNVLKTVTGSTHNHVAGCVYVF